MSLRVRTVFAMMVAAAVIVSIFGAFAQKLEIQHKAEAESRIEISVKNRNGVPLLTEVLKVLADMSADSRFSQALARQSMLSTEEGDCLASARKDPSGRVFDTAVCLGIWPNATKATYPKEFEKTFPIVSGTVVTSVFPAVQVKTFEFQFRMSVTQFGELASRNLVWIDGRLQPTHRFRDVLCNPRFTFIEPSKCEVVAVSRLGVYPDDIYVSQTGYRVQLTNVLSPELARELREEFLKRLTLPESTSSDAVLVSILRAEVVHPEQQATMAENPVSAPGADIESLWRFLGTDVDQLNLANSAEALPPTLMLFDGPEDKEPVLITDWLREITSARSNDCNSSDVYSRHTDEAASLLFPEALVASLRHKDGGAATIALLPSQEWTGFLLGAGYFKGTLQLNDLRWYEKSPARSRYPLLALVVYSRSYDSKNDSGAAYNAAESYLSDPSTLLVISAPERIKVLGALDFVGPIEPRIDPESLEAACTGHAWPACLGRHPRVLVVASSMYPEVEGRPVLAKKNLYMLGASTVRMVAPGIGVPVLSRCIEDGNWNTTLNSGTSFSAPQVALILSKLIQIAPEEVRSYLPEAAIWRILATSKPVFSEDEAADQLTEFGRLDAGLALRGASAGESGPDAAAMLYEVGGTVTQAVVMPYLWNDQSANLAPASKYDGFRSMGRNYITYYQPKTNRTETIEFKRLLRIVRRPDDFINGDPTFNIYYVADAPQKLVSVVVRKRVRLGPGSSVESQGYCRSDGLTTPDVDGAGLLTQAQPACLYAWRKDTNKFAPLDLTKVNDIVFPILHFNAEFPARLSPADLTKITTGSSPWRDAFCATGPRLRVKEILKNLRQPSWRVLCQ